MNLVYVLKFKNGEVYVGSHNGDKCYSRSMIISQSGNKYRRMYERKEITFKEYRDMVEDVAWMEMSSESRALNMERNLIKVFKKEFGDKCINVQMSGNKPADGYRYEHTEEWRRNQSEAVSEAWRTR